jgi:membrane-associated phospholipid phosphatase
MQTIDTSLFYAIHSLAGRSHVADMAIVAIGEYLIFPVILLVAFFVYRAWAQGQHTKVWAYAAALLSAFVSRFVVTSAIRAVYHHPRPFVTLQVPHLLNDSLYSFPSGHTIFMFALATGVYRVNKKLGWWLYGLGLLIGLARVAGGVHYPSDILGGMVLGIATTCCVVYIWKALSKTVALPTI